MADKLIGSHLLVRTHTADMAIPANRFVKLVGSTGAQPHCTLAGAGEAAVGVSRDGYDSGDLVDVVKAGEAWVLAIGNIGVGQPVAAAADGKADVATTANIVVGTAQTDANASEYVLVLLGQGGIF